MPEKDRDFDESPYTRHEAQVAEYLFGLGAGGGDDPVAFLIVSHAEIGRQNQVFRERLKQAGLSTDVYGDDDEPPPTP